MTFTDHFGLELITGDMLRAERIKHDCSIFEARRIVTGERLRQALAKSETVDDLKLIIRVLIDEHYPKDTRPR